jgi:hypothetical protein
MSLCVASEESTCMYLDGDENLGREFDMDSNKIWRGENGMRIAQKTR